MARFHRICSCFAILFLCAFWSPLVHAQTWLSSVNVSTDTTTATINWTTAVPSDSQLQYGPTTVYGSLSTLIATRTTAHSVALAGLTPGTTYHYMVMSRDSDGILVAGKDSTFATALPVTVSVAPNSTVLTCGATQQFTATVSNTTNTGVSWTTSAGTISASDQFTAPTVSTTTTITVTATSMADTSKSASATITINPVVAISISPTAGSVVSAAQQQFTATVSNTSNTAVNWSATAGTISTSGLFTAPVVSTATTVTVTVTSVADPTKSASAVITVVPAVIVAISPSTTTLLSAGQQQFTATVSNTANTAVTWSASAGTITTSGLFTAPTVSSSTTVTVRVASQADATRSASATVTVAPQAASSGLAIDAVAYADSSSLKSTVVSSTFSTTQANELLLAFVATDGGSGTMKVNSVTGAGLTWVLVNRANAQSGDAEVWRAFATTPLASVAVTASLAQAVGSSITVVSFAGVDATGTYGSGAIGASVNKSASSGAPSASLVTTRNNSWVFGIGMDYDSSTSRTLGANQSLVHQFLPSTSNCVMATWVQRQNGTTPLSGSTVTINDTAPTSDRYNLALVEILPAGGGAPPAPPATPTIGLSPTSWTFSATQGGSNPAPYSAGLTNSGGGTLTYTATSDAAWLSVSPGSGNAPSTLQITPNISGLSAGTYTGHITVSSTSASNSPVTMLCTLTVNAVAPPKPHTVTLGWTASSSSNVVNYSVYRGSTHGGPYALMSSALGSVSYTDSTVQSGLTYYYVATAVDNAGHESAYSNEVTAVIP